MRNEQMREFNPIPSEVAKVLKERQETCKLVFQENEVVEVKGRKMRIKTLYRKGLFLVPVGW